MLAVADGGRYANMVVQERDRAIVSEGLRCIWFEMARPVCVCVRVYLMCSNQCIFVCVSARNNIETTIL